MLCGLGALDELGSGVAPLSAAEIRSELDVTYGGLALVLLVAPLLLGIVVEGPLLLLSDRWPRKPLAAVSTALMGGCLLAAASARSPWLFAIALGVWGGIGGIACNTIKGVLMDAFPQARERWMTRWTLLGTIGDACTPVLVLGVAALGFGWRHALGLVGGLHLVHALALGRCAVSSAPRRRDRVRRALERTGVVRLAATQAWHA